MCLLDDFQLYFRISKGGAYTEFTVFITIHYGFLESQMNYC
jgi:hypothetical protein